MRMPLRYATAVKLCRSEKMRPAPGEEPAARKPGLGTGRVGRTGLAGLSSMGSRSARSCGRRRRPRIAERQPDIGIALRLTLHETISGVGPQQDIGVLVVENELALVRLDGENRMAIALLVAHYSDQQCLTRPARVHEHAALEQDVILAVAIAIVGIVPALDHAPMLQVSDR